MVGGTVETVGLGASAGGVEALQEFFRNLPAETGMAFIIVPHLAPDVESNMAEILQGVAAIPIVQVHQTVRIELHGVDQHPFGSVGLLEEKNRMILVGQPSGEEAARPPPDRRALLPGA